MSRHSPSRQSSFSYTDTPSRRSSVSSNPNVFSDDYALEPIDSRLDLSLQDSIQSEQTLSEHGRERDTLNITPYPAIPARLSTLNRPNSISKRPVATENTSFPHDGRSVRTLSTSSRFSFVRSQSPYSGPTQPSHPYAMYPQITRASSIASESTIRPQENPFIPTGGPEHPYSLYPQNTVPEDDADDIGTQPIPLGFPRLALPPPGASARSGSDVGDIIGSDGHIEQLPPYTRYADNVVAKGDMANIRDTLTSAPSRPVSQRSTLVASETRSVHIEDGESSEREILLSEEVKKETWKERAQRRVCGGIALWLLVLIVVLVMFAGVIGGVIGGVVGRRQGTNLALQSGAATSTIWIDADPASTNKDTPACPTGRYSIPFHQTQEINSCIMNGAYSWSWSCLDIAYLGITISDAIINGNKTLQVRFDDYSVNTSSFRYGPQPPDFNGTLFDLQPSNDKDNQQLGIAMFFYQFFDKLIILPPWAIIANSRRAIDARYVHERGSDHDGDQLNIGDQPWYCFWNQTINEFWIFLEEAAPPAPSETIASTAISSPVSLYSSSYQTSGSQTTAVSGTSTMWAGMSAFPTPTVTKRGAYTTPYLPQYPQLVKMIEKRRPEGNTQPYCQQMQVLADWQIVPLEDAEIVPIVESEYATDPVFAGNESRRKRDSTTEDLESNCVCEWMST